MAKRVGRWVGALLSGAALSMAVILGAHVVMARLMTPEDFGLAGLVTSIAVLLSVVTGGAAFEEALAQRRVLRRGHHATVLAVSFASSAAVIAILAAVAWGAGPAFGSAAFWPLLLVACLMVFPSAVTSTQTAHCRRRHAFGLLARAKLAGAVTGATLGIGLAALGAGAWALVAMRLAIQVGEAGYLTAGTGLVVRPAVSRERLGEIWRYSTFTFGQRIASEGSYMLINTVVAAFFSLTAVGYFNMALRLTEPLRGLFRGIAHNTAFEFMRERAQEREEFPERFAVILTIATGLMAPVFLGIGAISEPLMAVLLGPGWEGAAVIVLLIALGSSIILPLDLAATAMNARGLPSYLMGQRLIGLGALALGLAAAVILGLAGMGAGLARLAADGAEGTRALWAMLARLGIGVRRVAGAFLAPWACAALMALAVERFLSAWGAGGQTVAGLAAAVALGVAVYAALTALLVPRLRRMAARAVSG